MKPKIKVAVLASGRGSNFEALANACRDEDYPARIEMLFVDNPDAGALAIAERFGIDAFHIDCGQNKGSMSPGSSQKMARMCKERGIDLICLAGFMRIVKGEVLERYGGRMMNIHPALLPSFKGLHGQRQALDYGVRFSGCTVHFVDAGVDTGPIIIQRIVPVNQDDDEDELSTRILAEEHKAYPEAVRLYAEGKLSIDGRRVIIKNHES
jgi:phosphoribosylglycinamide formyltransferase-1